MFCLRLPVSLEGPRSTSGFVAQTQREGGRALQRGGFWRPSLSSPRSRHPKQRAGGGKAARLHLHHSVAPSAPTGPGLGHRGARTGRVLSSAHTGGAGDPLAPRRPEQSWEARPAGPRSQQASVRGAQRWSPGQTGCASPQTRVGFGRSPLHPPSSRPYQGAWGQTVALGAQRPRGNVSEQCRGRGGKCRSSASRLSGLDELGPGADPPRGRQYLNWEPTPGQAPLGKSGRPAA